MLLTSQLKIPYEHLVLQTFSRFYQLLTWTSKGESVNTTGKSALILFDVGKFVSPTKQTCAKFSNFEELYLDCKIKQKVWNEAENRERDWGETLKIPTGV